MKELEVENLIRKASACEESGDYEGMFAAISEGLRESPFNYELYLQLGNYYLSCEGNAMRAMLCFQNALFYCHDSEDRVLIQGFYDSVLAWAGKAPSNVSIVIVSYNSAQIMKECIESIRLTCDPAITEIVVVDNASTDGIAEWLSEQKDIKAVLNKDNLGFGGGSNQGMQLAEPANDIFFLNNDTIMTPNALFWLRMGLYGGDDIGAAGAFSNYPGNDQSVEFDYKNIDEFVRKATLENIPRKEFLLERIWISGFALLARGDLIRKLGGFDLSFGAGYFEDNDLCVRMEMEGYRIVACSNSAIYHYGSTSFRKNPERVRKLLAQNRELFKSRWGGVDLNDYCTISMKLVDKVIEFCPATPGEELAILDIDCKAGALLSKIKAKFEGRGEYYGIAKHDILYEIASLYHEVVKGDFSENAGMFSNEKFDFVVCEDFRLTNIETLGEIRCLLKKEGKFIFTASTDTDVQKLGAVLFGADFDVTLINGVYSKEETEEPDYYIAVVERDDGKEKQ